MYTKKRRHQGNSDAVSFIGLVQRERLFPPTWLYQRLSGYADAPSVIRPRHDHMKQPRLDVPGVAAIDRLREFANLIADRARL